MGTARTTEWIEMNDWLATLFSPEQIREGTIEANVISAFFIGPYLAFAATPDAGIRCFQAFVRLFHRWVLVAFAIALMNNALVLANSDRVPTASAMVINMFILISTLVSASRYWFWIPDIPKDASWRHPHLPHRKTAREAAAEREDRRRGNPA
jgi:hypothetical protein